MISDPAADGSSFAPLAELAEMFTALVETMHNGDPVRFTAGRIVELAGRCVPASKGAELMMLEQGRPRTIASVGVLADGAHLARLHTGEGPSLDVLETNDLVVAGDLVEDDRWPESAHRITRDTAIRSIASYRLYLGPKCKAALTFYSDWPYAFDSADTAIGAIFAAYCSLALFGDVLADSPSLRRAAEVHREIGVAAGFLLTTGEHDACPRTARCTTATGDCTSVSIPASSTPTPPPMSTLRHRTADRLRRGRWRGTSRIAHPTGR